MNASQGGFIHFLLIWSGICCFVAAVWQLPRFERLAALHGDAERLRARVAESLDTAREYECLAAAVRTDPHFREAVLRRVTGERPHRVQTLSEWIGARAAPPAHEVSALGQRERRGSDKNAQGVRRGRRN